MIQASPGSNGGRGYIDGSTALSADGYHDFVERELSKLELTVEDLFARFPALSQQERFASLETIRAAGLTAASVAIDETGPKKRKGSPLFEFSHYAGVANDVAELYLSAGKEGLDIPYGISQSANRQLRQKDFRHLFIDEAVLAIKAALLHDTAEELIDTGFTFDDSIRHVMAQYATQLGRTDPHEQQLRTGLHFLTKDRDVHYFAYLDLLVDTPLHWLKPIKITDRRRNIEEIEGLSIDGRVSKNLAKTLYIANRMKEHFVDHLADLARTITPTLLPTLNAYLQLIERATAECAKIEMSIRTRIAQLSSDDAYATLEGTMPDFQRANITSSTLSYQRFMEGVFGRIDAGLDLYDRRGRLNEAYHVEPPAERRSRLVRIFAPGASVERTDVLFDGLLHRSTDHVMNKSLIDGDASGSAINAVDLVQYYSDAAQMRRIFARLGNLRNRYYIPFDWQAYL